jgi:hypothetical protein
MCRRLLCCVIEQVTKLNEDMNRIRSAKDALGLPLSADTRLNYVSEECADLKEAWTAIVPASEKLAATRALPIKVSRYEVLLVVLD